MLESIQPPTDNLYKFVAIGGLVFALVATVFLFREQAKFRDQWIEAQIELQVAGYEDGDPIPTDIEPRRAYMRREWEHTKLKENVKLGEGVLAKVSGYSLGISLCAFVAWWWRVQRHDDAILKAAASKALREEAEAEALAARESKSTDSKS